MTEFNLKIKTYDLTLDNFLINNFSLMLRNFGNIDDGVTLTLNNCSWECKAD